MPIRKTIRAWSPLLMGVALAASTSLAMAQGGTRPLFEWNGRVNREVQITMRGRNVWTRGFEQSDRLPGPDIMTALPRDEGVVRVRLEGGQGDVQVIQQPTAENDYTTIVRVRDTSNSGEFNHVRADWLPYSTSGGEVMEREDVVPPEGRYPGERLVLHWAGRVDDALEIRIQGDHITYRTLRGNSVRDISAQMTTAGLPMDDLRVRLHELEGRGTVTIVQQPNLDNNYTAVVRIFDPQPRYGTYDFDLTVRR